MAHTLTPDRLIFRVAISVPVYRLFDYLAPSNITLEDCKPGVRLEVPFGKGRKIAFLLEVTQHSELETSKLKQVLRILDDKPLLSAKDIRLLHWSSRYYHHPLGEVFSTAFPADLRQGKPIALTTEKCYSLTDLGKGLDSAELQRSPKQKKYPRKISSPPYLPFRS